MLHDFVTENRTDLISRCKAKAAQRHVPLESPAVFNNGVPLFLEQLVAALLLAELDRGAIKINPTEIPKLSDISRSAALHGAELLRTGYSIEQVVHDYGDVCQSITEMATEQKIPISTDDFRVLNGSLDDAIAESVKEFGTRLHGTLISNNSDNWQQRHNSAIDQLRLIDIAIRAHEAIRTAAIGVTGSTGTLLIYALQELRKLAENDLAGIRLALEKINKIN